MLILLAGKPTQFLDFHSVRTNFVCLSLIEFNKDSFYLTLVFAHGSSLQIPDTFEFAENGAKKGGGGPDWTKLRGS